MSGVWVGHGARELVVALLRTLVTVALMVVAYYLAPLDRALDVRIGLWLGTGLVALGSAIAWQVRAIAASHTPRLRAAETIAVALPLMLLLFAEVYLLLAHNEPGSFSQPLSRTGALYFTMTVFATVGFGDITPLTDRARVVTMVQMAVGLVAVGLVVRQLLGAVEKAVDRKESSRDERPRA